MLSPFMLILLIDNMMRCEMKKMHLHDVLVFIMVTLNFTVAAASSLMKEFIGNYNYYVLGDGPLPGLTVLFQESAHWYWLFALLCMIGLVIPFRKFFHQRLCIAFAAPMLWILLILASFILMNYRISTHL